LEGCSVSRKGLRLNIEAPNAEPLGLVAPDDEEASCWLTEIKTVSTEGLAADFVLIVDRLTPALIVTPVTTTPAFFSMKPVIYLEDEEDRTPLPAESEIDLSSFSLLSADNSHNYERGRVVGEG
jgi:hypothetical protein